MKRIFILFCLLSNIVFARTLTIKDSISLATMHNKKIKAKKIAVSIEESKVREAKKDYIMPTISGGVNYTFTDPWYVDDMTTTMMYPKISYIGGSPQITGFEESEMKQAYSHIFSSYIQLNYTLFAWGLFKNKYEMSKVSYELANRDILITKADIIYSTYEAFYYIIVAREMLEVAKDSYNRLLKHKKIAQANYARGLKPRLEVLQIETEIASAKTQIINAKKSLELAKLNLKQITGIPLDEDINIEGELNTNIITIKYEDALKKALANRLELKKINMQKNMLGYSKNMLRAKTLPMINVFAKANANYIPEKDDNELTTPLNLGVVVSFPLTDLLPAFSRTTEEINQVDMQIKNIELAKKQLIDGIKLELKSLILSLNEAIDKIEAAKQSVSLAKESIRQATDNYRKGLISSTMLMDSETALNRAKLGEISAYFEYNITLVKIKKAIGELYE